MKSEKRKNISFIILQDIFFTFFVHFDYAIAVQHQLYTPIGLFGYKRSIKLFSWQI